MKILILKKTSHKPGLVLYDIVIELRLEPVVFLQCLKLIFHHSVPLRILRDYLTVRPTLSYRIFQIIIKQIFITFQTIWFLTKGHMKENARNFDKCLFKNFRHFQMFDQTLKMRLLPTAFHISWETFFQLLSHVELESLKFLFFTLYGNNLKRIPQHISKIRKIFGGLLYFKLYFSSIKIEIILLYCNSTFQAC